MDLESKFLPREEGAMERGRRAWDRCQEGWRRQRGEGEAGEGRMWDVHVRTAREVRGPAGKEREGG